MFELPIRPRTRLTRAVMLTAGVMFWAAFPGIGTCACPGAMDDGIQVIPGFPADIPEGASCATLTDAAKFAWREFIALNWPAVARIDNNQPRDTADPFQLFGNPGYAGPLVWHTFRGKVEIFPGQGEPPGYSSNGADDYGYDARPAYNYKVPIAAYHGISYGPTPWINLDENSQIGLNQIYAGVLSPNVKTGDAQILFMAKSNRKEYGYVAANQLLGGESDKRVAGIFQATAQYIQDKGDDPLPTCSGLICLPYGSVEIKAAWRRLTASERASGRFYTTRVRYYVKGDGTDNSTYYVDDDFGLIGLHIIQKTSSAPYFIYATFEQADNILDAAGKPVEDVDGEYTANLIPPNPLYPNIFSKNAQPGTTQQFSYSPKNFNSPPGARLYYQNTANTGLVDGGPIIVSRRINRIPDDIIAVNKLAHDAISTYSKKNFNSSNSVWSYYKLVNVQSKPIAGKIPGIDYSDNDRSRRSTYYQSNGVIETDYNLQKFSGTFIDFNGYNFKITDFAKGTKDQFNNVTYNHDSVNMGGCMGCHGNAQKAGTGFSFILLHGRVPMPDLAGQPVTKEQIARFAKYFAK